MNPTPEKAAAMPDRPLPAPPAAARRRAFRSVGELEDVRAFATRVARSAGLPDLRVERVVLAVNEVATNSFEHATGGCVITMWVERGSLVCQIDDDGRFGAAVRVPPPDLESRGHGLMLVDEITDVVRRHVHAGGTSTRLHFTIG
ncbi:ATP-binding protein [Nonomuraea roseoviolacea]|uniref:Anti-sigma regulatory factor (Ser/Thr protein kinase) n=1 Tax=Nonomuraea roseoviolacea subsp. carminata TaxID=160689 RepID=A0ABT1K8N1_9ACTN|nr:ATP-binding protein [Nonomuraea roseoviolacea]MCP2349942.1 anti-sigma regulatory factor (Ser/Thr protein kinase) [Nonomuraea roseoviolacea subsp. carminata]